MCAMDQEVKPGDRRRRYDGSRRRAAAGQTRQAIVVAARQLFLERGYAATTMPAIAAAAGVALDTVYASVGPKPALFGHMVEISISGAEEPVPALERDYVQEIRAESDPRRKLELYARAMRLIQERLAPLFRVLRDAAQGDAQLTALWEQISQRRAANMRMLAAELAAAGGLREGVSVKEAADVIWVTNAPEFFLLLVHERRWDPDRFESWLAATWIRLLLP
jgi:AcrR family transcriptional regulator